jgi:AcrR family transcriptional regulator
MNHQTTDQTRISRGEETRRKLLQAAVSSLGRNGYASTTVDALMQAAGVSRGSVLHQFPTRLDLMAAAAEFAMNSMVLDTVERIEEFDSATRQLDMLAQVMWEVHNSTSANALTEVLLASRWDRDLAMRLTPVAERIEAEIDSLLGKIADRCGVANPIEVLAWGRLMIASMRGLIIELMLQPDRQMIIAARDTLLQQHAKRVREWLG